MKKAILKGSRESRGRWKTNAGQNKVQKRQICERNFQTNTNMTHASSIIAEP